MIKVTIRKNATGEERVYVDNFSEGLPDWSWAEGNDSCDCNRHLYWHRAGGVEPEDDAPCGERLYSVTRMEDSAGRIELGDPRGEPAAAVR